MARTKQEEVTFQAAFERFGEPHQLLVAFEEMAELTKAISKAIRYSREGHKTAITEEIADVEIMLEQVKMIFGIDDEDVEMWRLDKIVRLRRTLGILPKEDRGD
jgi:NTP pyrophosphatase (non-canonical NTP hydrolase)